MEVTSTCDHWHPLLVSMDESEVPVDSERQRRPPWSNLHCWGNSVAMVNSVVTVGVSALVDDLVTATDPRIRTPSVHSGAKYRFRTRRHIRPSGMGSVLAWNPARNSLGSRL